MLHIEVEVSLYRGLLAVEDHPERALQSLREAIDAAETYAMMPDPVLTSYEGVADIWLDGGRVREAAVLTAAVDQVREVIQVSGQLDPLGAPRRERVHAALREQLGERELEVLSARGRALTRDEMRRFVLDEMDPLDALSCPSGTVTFLFTDLEGSTRLWEEHPDAMQEALARHDEILRDAVDGHARPAS